VIDLGVFEVYGREDARESAFDYAFFEGCKPFPQHPPNLRCTDFGTLQCVFFVICNDVPTRWSDDFIAITDVMKVTFEWEG
jgi:hypothetical protein